MSAPLLGSSDTEPNQQGPEQGTFQPQAADPRTSRRPVPPIPRRSMRRRSSILSQQNPLEGRYQGNPERRLSRLSTSSEDESAVLGQVRDPEKDDFFHEPQVDSRAPTLRGSISGTSLPYTVPERRRPSRFPTELELKPSPEDIEATAAISTTTENHALDNRPSRSPSPSSTLSPDQSHDHTHPRPRLSFRARLKHFTWAWYTLSMSTGGLSLLIHAQPHQFPSLTPVIGLAVYILNILLFTLITSLLLARFFFNTGSFVTSITHPREGFFVPTFFLSIATLITSTQKYCIPAYIQSWAGERQDLRWAIQIAFWVYVALSTCLAVAQYSFVFGQRHSFGLQTMMPTWILPIFPVMLSGTIASVIASTQPPAMALPIIVSGLSCQGLGISVAAMMYAHMVGRLMQSGLPDREHRPGLFMCVGPPSFTALAFIGLAQSLPGSFDVNMDGLLDSSIMLMMAIVGAGFLWALSFWWFAIAVLAVVQSPPRYFHLGWWASVFPNTGFILATISLGKVFQNEFVLWFSTAMSIVLLAVYAFVLFHCVRAVVVMDIVYPGRDEDVEDH
ncbi:voltage-dependent anion channel-domain-containing protein [Triangularia setosa]|uniref:Voltage-dependent anion channel-domain-containing protein n=1 Tax=Triangularia setosa TaxID=2587417 RepID=A0AAN6WGW0_9PEZI|nr:voltage-dependent anion channel-domain-containing protein [Podospora setosa]